MTSEQTNRVMEPEELATAVADRLGGAARIEESLGAVTVEVSPESWIDALRVARDEFGCDFFDWLTAVDELNEGFAIVAHVFSLEERHHLLLRTRVPRESPTLASAVPVYRGANWHERETYEMFGVGFTGHPGLKPLLLPDGFEGHPLRKEFVLAARVAKPWPGAKEPGESGHGGAPSRRRMRPPGVPDNWGPTARKPARPTRPAEPAAPDASRQRRPEAESDGDRERGRGREQPPDDSERGGGNG